MWRIAQEGFIWLVHCWRPDEQANDNSIKSLSQSYSTFISTSPAFLEIINPEIKLQLLNKKIQLKIWLLRKKNPEIVEFSKDTILISINFTILYNRNLQ